MKKIVLFNKINYYTYMRKYLCQMTFLRTDTDLDLMEVFINYQGLAQSSGLITRSFPCLNYIVKSICLLKYYRMRESSKIILEMVFKFI